MTDPTEPQIGGDPEADRLRKLERLREELGVGGYGGRVEGLTALAAARRMYDADADENAKADPDNDNRPLVKVAGRIVLHRDIGKLVFMTLRDASGDLQVAVSKKRVDEPAFKLAKLVDLGDVVIAAGPLGATKTGEITVWATARGTDHSAFELACKSLAPPPEKWSGLKDPELRYRRRYVDLYANPEVMRMMQLRIRIIDEIRDYLRGQGYQEVETPMLQPIHGGAAAKPFVTHHNAGAVSQAPARRRVQQGLRDQPQLPQRRHQPPPQPRVHHARGLRGVRVLANHGRPRRRHGLHRGAEHLRDVDDSPRRHGR
jgi:lysyl-tRNA synthetase class 2